MPDSTKANIELSDEEFTQIVGEINLAYEELISNLNRLKFLRSKYVIYQAQQVFIEDVFAFIKQDIRGSSKLPTGH